MALDYQPGDGSWDNWKGENTMNLSDSQRTFLENNHSAAMTTIARDGTPRTVRIGFVGCPTTTTSLTSSGKLLTCYAGYTGRHSTSASCSAPFPGLRAYSKRGSNRSAVLWTRRLFRPLGRHFLFDGNLTIMPMTAQESSEVAIVTYIVAATGKLEVVTAMTDQLSIPSVYGAQPC